MPIHDWTLVSAGTWQSFHGSWITEILRALTKLLPAGYYAQQEQVAGPFGADLLTLHATGSSASDGDQESGGLAVAFSPPRAKLVAEDDMDYYVLRRRTLVIRHVSNDEIVALIEIVSPGNKSSNRRFRAFVDKAVESLYRGYHLLIVDLFPPTKRDPNGIHAAIWEEFSDRGYTPPEDAPLTLVSYSAGDRKRAYLEATAVGRELIEMPLFLDPDNYVNVPLESTYREAFSLVPAKYRSLLEE